MLGGKRRGGKRFRKMKERLGLTDTHKAASRIAFGAGTGVGGPQAMDAPDYADAAMGLDYGMLGRDGGGKLRKRQRQAAKAYAGQQPKGKKRKGGGTASAAESGLALTRRRMSYMGGSSGASSGLSSSLVFTPVQGMERVAPGASAAARQQRVREANSKFFGDKTGFASVIKKE